MVDSGISVELTQNIVSPQPTVSEAGELKPVRVQVATEQPSAPSSKKQELETLREARIVLAQAEIKKKYLQLLNGNANPTIEQPMIYAMYINPSHPLAGELVANVMDTFYQIDRIELVKNQSPENAQKLQEMDRQIEGIRGDTDTRKQSNKLLMNMLSEHIGLPDQYWEKFEENLNNGSTNVEDIFLWLRQNHMSDGLRMALQNMLGNHAFLSKRIAADMDIMDKAKRVKEGMQFNIDPNIKGRMVTSGIIMMMLLQMMNLNDGLTEERQ